MSGNLRRSPTYFKIAIALVGPLLRLADHTPNVATGSGGMSKGNLRVIIGSLGRVQKILLGAGKGGVAAATDARAVAADFRCATSIFTCVSANTHCQHVDNKCDARKVGRKVAAIFERAC